VAADIFGGRMHGDGGAMPDGLAQYRAGRVVHDKRHTEVAADPRHFGDRKDLELGVGQRLAVVAAGSAVGSSAEILGIGRIDEAALDAHGAHGVLEQVPGAAIDIRRANEIVAGMADVLHREQRRRLSRSEPKRSGTAFKGGDTFLQHCLRRVHDAGVDVAPVP